MDESIKKLYDFNLDRLGKIVCCMENQSYSGQHIDTLVVMAAIAQDTGALLKGHRDRTRQKLDLAEGSGSGIKVETDNTADRYIRQNLHEFLSSPTIVSETDRIYGLPSRGSFFVVDGCDGTGRYVKQDNVDLSSFYSVSIGYVSADGTPQMGVVFDVVRDRLFIGVVNCPSVCNGNKLYLGRPDFEKILPSKLAVFTNSSKSAPYELGYKDATDSITRDLKNNGLNVDTIHNVSLLYCFLAKGSIPEGKGGYNPLWASERKIQTPIVPSAAVRLYCDIWDHMGALPVVSGVRFDDNEESALKVCNAYGQPINLGSNGSSIGFEGGVPAYKKGMCVGFAHVLDKYVLPSAKNALEKLVR